MFDVEAVIFDMDGTLLNTEFLAKKFWRSAMEKHDLLVEESFLDNMLGKSQQAVRHNIELIYGQSVPYDSIKEVKLKEELLYYDKNPLPLKDGAIEILEYFQKQKSLPIALATSTERYRTDMRLAKGKLDSYFQYTLCGDEVLKPKPDPEMYVRVCSMLGVSPASTIVFEDSPSGVEAAVEAGTNVVWIKDIIEIPSQLEKRLWRKISSLNEFIGSL